MRSHSARIGVDVEHLVRRRRWTEPSPRAAVSSATTWQSVADAMDLHSRTAVATIKGHVARLGLDVSHIANAPVESPARQFSHDPENLHRTGSSLAAAWFALCGCDVSWPLEPSRYDLVVCIGGQIRRVQVKTTISRVGSTWQVFLSTSGRERRTYSPDEIDDFFVITGDLSIYLIPLAVVGGLHAISLSSCAEYRVSQHGVGHGLMS